MYTGTPDFMHGGRETILRRISACTGDRVLHGGPSAVICQYGGVRQIRVDYSVGKQPYRPTQGSPARGGGAHFLEHAHLLERPQHHPFCRIQAAHRPLSRLRGCGVLLRGACADGLRYEQRRHPHPLREGKISSSLKLSPIGAGRPATAQVHRHIHATVSKTLCECMIYKSYICRMVSLHENVRCYQNDAGPYEPQLE